jgi:Family of unknown function (DUF6178)
MSKFNGPASRQSPDRKTLLERILDTPDLERVVPRLQPELLHRVIQRCGLEDCGELVTLATTEQLQRIFDLDLWRSAQPGQEEQFDAERFGVWLEVLVESGGAGAAAQKLAQMDADLVISGLAQHARVFDLGVVTPYRTTDGTELPGIREPDGVASDVGGYRLVAKRTDSWEAIVEVLMSLDAEHPDYFHRVMRGCRDLSDSGRELDGLDNLLDEAEQSMFDLAHAREQRRDDQGYVTPAQARVFLQMSRRLRLESDALPPANPVARAYFRSLDGKAGGDSKPPEPFADSPEGTSPLLDVLLDAGIIAQPRALLKGGQEQTASRRIESLMQVVFECDHQASIRRSEELTYLANTLMAGCAFQGRSFPEQEAGDAAMAVCNLGLENWPRQWSAAKSLPDDFLIKQDLLVVFQVGWTVLYKDVVMYSTGRLLAVLGDLHCDDLDVQSNLDELRNDLLKAFREGMPWRVREEMDALATLDIPAWAVLLGLIDECPVLHAVLSAAPKTRSVRPDAFEFISENRQIGLIREFLEALPETLQS